LGFFYGVGVADPTGLPEGSDKRMRSSKISSVLAAQNPALVPLVRHAWKFGSIAVTQAYVARRRRRTLQAER
jgi:hypothetical protein